jgi:hypothetical protein
VNTPLAEREVSGSPLEGGDHVAIAPQRGYYDLFKIKIQSLFLSFFLLMAPMGLSRRKSLFYLSPEL